MSEGTIEPTAPSTAPTQGHPAGTNDPAEPSVPGQPPGLEPTAPPPEPAQQPPPAAPAQPPEQQQPAAPPDLGDAVQQMNQQLQEIRERVVGPAQPEGEPDFMASLFGDDEPDAGADPLADPQGVYAQQQPQAQPQQPQQPQDPNAQADAQFEQRLEAYIQDRVHAALEPTLQQQQLNDDRREIMGLRDKYPRLAQPEIAQAVGQRLKTLAQRYDNEAMRTDPILVEREYLAHEAVLAGVQQPQPSPGAAVPGQPAPAGVPNPAEAGGQPVQPGVVMETGAGPSVPQPQLDPVAQAYVDALTGGNQPPPTDIIS